jgi:hypothetical protein
MSKNYTDKTGLLYVIVKIKNLLAGKVDKVEGSSLMLDTDKTKLDGIAEGANNYTHPSYTSHTSDLYKVTVDASGHVSDATKVVKSDITGLGIPGESYTHPTYTAQSNGFYKVTVDGTGHVNGVTSVAKSDITGLGIPDNDTMSTAIATAVGNIQGISYKVVTELPTTGEAGVIYLMSNGGKTGNIYDEYIWVTDKFEKIGTTEVDLSGYVKDADLVAITNTEIDAMFAS